jgi:subtilisin family serine protease
MKYKIFPTLATLFSLFSFSLTFAQGAGFQKVRTEKPNEVMTFCVDNIQQNVSLLETEGIGVKYSTKNWLFITTTPRWVDDALNDGRLNRFYFEFAPPVALDDTARVTHKIDQVHAGLGGLPQGYTGKGVIIGLVDTGIDFNHPDFKDSLGKTRVLRYWDQTVSGASPQPYNYGQEWDSTAINAGTVTASVGGSIHGSSVTGIAAGNGLANGANKGMAPDANIIMIQTNFNLSNWTLTVADACDYVFKIADEYGMPAIVNLSLGTYLGSHDGNDPASEAIEQLIDAKPGRIVVAAAGNSGAWAPYHCRGTATVDTSFVWIKNNPSGAFGANKIYYDIWADTAQARTIDFAYGADSPSPDYTLRGKTNFKNMMTGITPQPARDTIYNSLGQRIAIIESYRSIEGANFHLEVLYTTVDSTTFLYRFMTKGSGVYDMWSGTVIGANELVSTDLPTSTQMSKIVHYNTPDLEQSIVSSWNCSEKVVTVGNMRNRLGHIDRNYNQYYPNNYPSAVGQLSPNSSKGPTRKGVIKPDITASGDITLGASTYQFLNNPANYGSLDSGGMHLRNGGTSMASPVIAGIAALYLERCPKGNYQAFLSLLHSTAMKDGFTGATENNAYGYGKADALALMNALIFEPNPVIAQNGSILTATASPNYQWSKDAAMIPGAMQQTLNIAPPNGIYSVYTLSPHGCTSTSADYQSNLGIEMLKLEQSIIYPNPTKGEFSIADAQNVEAIKCYDLKGNELKIKTLSNNRFDASELPQGIYILELKFSDRLVHLKFSRND